MQVAEEARSSSSLDFSEIAQLADQGVVFVGTSVPEYVSKSPKPKPKSTLARFLDGEGGDESNCHCGCYCGVCLIKGGCEEECICNVCVDACERRAFGRRFMESTVSEQRLSARAKWKSFWPSTRMPARSNNASSSRSSKAIKVRR